MLNHHSYSNHYDDNIKQCIVDRAPRGPVFGEAAAVCMQPSDRSSTLII